MKKIAIALLLTIGSLSLKAQIEIADTAQFKEFFSTTTYFVKDANLFSEFNYYISDAAQKAWSITPYKVITYDEYKRMPLTKGKSFVMTTYVFPEKHPELRYEFLTVLLGGHGSKLGSKGGSMPVLAAIPLAFAGDDVGSYDYKLVPFLLFLQKHIRLAADNPKLTGRDYLKYYNDNIPKLKTKTLVFTRGQIDEVLSISDIQKYYKGNIKIMQEEEIANLIKQNDTTIVFAHIVSAPVDDEINPDAYCYKMLFDAQGNLYYFGWHKMNNAQINVFLKQDFIKLGKKLGK